MVARISDGKRPIPTQVDGVTKIILIHDTSGTRACWTARMFIKKRRGQSDGPRRLKHLRAGFEQEYRDSGRTVQKRNVASTGVIKTNWYNWSAVKVRICVWGESTETKKHAGNQVKTRGPLIRVILNLG